jgi:predicted GNAT family acetyltransferase
MTGSSSKYVCSALSCTSSIGARVTHKGSRKKGCGSADVGTLARQRVESAEGKYYIPAP